jgi:hypothetical protein
VVEFGGGREGIGNFAGGDAESLKDGVDGFAPGEQGGIGFSERLARGTAKDAVEHDGMQAINFGEPGALYEKGLWLAGAGIENQAQVGACAYTLSQGFGQGFGLGQASDETAAALGRLAGGGPLEVEQQAVDITVERDIGQAVELTGDGAGADEGPGVALQAPVTKLIRPALDI